MTISEISDRRKVAPSLLLESKALNHQVSPECTNDSWADLLNKPGIKKTLTVLFIRTIMASMQPDFFEENSHAALYSCR